MSARLRPTQLKQIREMVRQSYRTKEIAFEVGVSESTVHKVRQNRYPDRRRAARGENDQPEAQWCPRCRCHVFPPCQVCRLRNSGASHARSSIRRPPAEGSIDPEMWRRLELSVADIGLPVRTINYLQHRQIMTVHDLLGHTAAELRSIPNFGKKTMDQIYRVLERLGFKRKASRRDGDRTCPGRSAKKNTASLRKIA